MEPSGSRSGLFSYVDQLVSIHGGDRVPATGPRPVLVIEGYGGSGRSSVVRRIARDWRVRTMTAELNTGPAPTVNDDAPQPLLAAVLLMMLAGTRAPGFEDVTFDRVVLAYIAMEKPVTTADPARATEEMAERVNAYRRRSVTVSLLGASLAAARDVITSIPDTTTGVAGGQQAFNTLVTAVSQDIVNRIGRSPLTAKLTWKRALAWYDQDRREGHYPLVALVRLSSQAALLGRTDLDEHYRAAIQEEIDDRLLAALLADLQHGLQKIKNRPANALLLVDDADSRPAQRFIRSLIRVRQARAARHEPADPLTVIVTSGGALGATVDEGACVREVLGDLTETDVRQAVEGFDWPATVVTKDITDAVYQLVAGHPAGTGRVLADLHREVSAAPAEAVGRDVVASLGAIFDRVAPDLRRRAVSGLLGHGIDVERAVDDLATLAAARDLEEADALLGLLDLSQLAGQVITSPVLWSAPGLRPGQQPAQRSMPKALRLLLLRRLGDRGGTRDWSTVFTALQREAADDDLHHLLMLDGVEDVAKRLADVLPDVPGRDWLAMLDRTVVTPDMSRPAPAAATGPVGRLVSHLQCLIDPRFHHYQDVNNVLLEVAQEYDRLAEVCHGDRKLFIRRAQRCRRRADGVS